MQSQGSIYPEEKQSMVTITTTMPELFMERKTNRQYN